MPVPAALLPSITTKTLTLKYQHPIRLIICKLKSLFCSTYKFCLTIVSNWATKPTWHYFAISDNLYRDNYTSSTNALKIIIQPWVDLMMIIAAVDWKLICDINPINSSCWWCWCKLYPDHMLAISIRLTVIPSFVYSKHLWTRGWINIFTRHIPFLLFIAYFSKKYKK